MEKTQFSFHSESSMEEVHNPVALHLLLELQRQIDRQVHFAGNHMNHLCSRFPSPLLEWLHPLRGNELVGEEEIQAQELEEQVHLAVGVGEVGSEGEVAVQIERRVEVDASEASFCGVEEGVLRLDHEEDDEGGGAGEDDGDAEHEAEHRRQPDKGVGPPGPPEELCFR